MSPKNKHKERESFFRSKKGIVLLVIFILILAASVFFISRIEQIAEQRLLTIINTELAPNAEIEFGDFSFTVLPAGVVIQKIQLVHRTPFNDHIPTKSADAIRKFEIKRLEFTGINLFNMLKDRQWRLGGINIDDLDIELVPLSGGRLTDATPFKQPPPFLIENINMKNVDLSIFSERESQYPLYSIKNIYSEIENVSVKDIDEPFYTYFDDVNFQSSEFTYNTSDGNYTIGIDSVSTSSSGGFFYAEGGRINPLFSAHEMAEKIGFETDQFEISFENLNVEQFDIRKWFEENELSATGTVINGPSIIIHRDKSFPKEPRNARPLPFKNLKELPFGLQVDTLRFTNGFLSYTEDFTDENRKGNISFHDINLRVEKLQNHQPEDTITVHVNTRFMDITNLNLQSRFTLMDDASHVLQGSMSGFDLTLLNEPIEQWIFLRVRKGQVNQIDFYFSANDDRANGVLKMIYNDLEIRFLDESSLTETRNRRLKSFFANRLRVRSNNRFDNARTGTIEFERDKERSIFNYWWKSIATGLEDSVKR